MAILLVVERPLYYGFSPICASLLLYSIYSALSIIIKSQPSGNVNLRSFSALPPLLVAWPFCRRCAGSTGCNPATNLPPKPRVEAESLRSGGLIPVYAFSASGTSTCTASFLSLGLRKMHQPKVISGVLGGIILGVLLESASIRAMHPLTDAITRSNSFWPYTRIQRTAFSL
jgi:hypothetical protein